MTVFTVFVLMLDTRAVSLLLTTTLPVVQGIEGSLGPVITRTINTK